MGSEINQLRQELPDRTDYIFGPLLGGDIKRIEYKPQTPVLLLGVYSDAREQDSR